MSFSNDDQAQRRKRDSIPRILVLADLSCYPGRGEREPLLDRAIRKIDADNFDALLKRYAPGIGSDPASRITFERLEDFHPDSLYRHLTIFAALRDLRSRLADPATFEAASAELLSETAQSEPDEAAPASDSGDMFDRLLGAPAGSGAGKADQGRGLVSKMMADVVAPYIEPDIADRQAQLVSSVDQSIAQTMNVVLHAAPFQRCEGLWRALRDLVFSFDAEDEAQVYVMDVTADELMVDLGSETPLEQSSIYRRVVEREKDTAGGEPWAAVVSDLSFGQSPDSLALAAYMGGLAAHAGGPLLAAADPALFGAGKLEGRADPDDWTVEGRLAGAWAALREHPVAQYIGLAAPRLLGRLPYGRQTDEIDSFDYDEFANGRNHADYLWTTPAFAVARALVAELSGYDGLDIDDLPMHVFEEDGEREIQPCAEAWLADRAAQQIMGAGIMPVLSVRGSNRARIVRLQSIAESPTALT
ncbi:MAG: hypothetical protein HKN49_12570 [Gammaproteobacteria bacterium]|nr:hypothetical protein [Gammaproteobacteria bacterium]